MRWSWDRWRRRTDLVVAAGCGGPRDALPVVFEVARAELRSCAHQRGPVVGKEIHVDIADDLRAPLVVSLLLDIDELVVVGPSGLFDVDLDRDRGARTVAHTDDLVTRVTPGPAYDSQEADLEGVSLRRSDF